MEIYNNNFEEKKESNEISDRLKGYISNYFDGCQVYTHKAEVADDKYLVGKQSSSSDEDIDKCAKIPELRGFLVTP